MWDVACLSLKIFSKLFCFAFLFSSYFRFVAPRVVRIVFGGCNQFSFALFSVVFESLYWCINAIFNAGKSSSPFFLDTYSLSTSFLRWKALYMVISFLVLCFICLRSYLVYFTNGPEYFTKRTAQVFIPFIRFQLFSLLSSSFLVFLKFSF